MFSKLKFSLLRFFLCVALVASVVPVYASNSITLPKPGAMLALSQPYAPLVLRGLKFNPQRPFDFDFMVDRAQSGISDADLKIQSVKLAKFFLTALTIPEKDLWVNLSPYESKRIITSEFGQTEMGVDLLAQDYILKQITASLIYPEGKVGRQFWAKVYKQAQEKFGTANIPVNTFNKVWIIPQEAVVYEQGNAVFITKSKLKVMLEQDYLALTHHSKRSEESVNALGSQIVREIVIPQLEREVNEGANFAPLRQIYQSMILAVWYKQKIKNSLIDKAYVDHQKIAGVNVGDKQAVQKIYNRYLEAFKKGAYNYIKEEPDAVTGEMIPRKYFSGGTEFSDLTSILSRAMNAGPELKRADFAMIKFQMNPERVHGDKAMPIEEIGNESPWEKLVSVLGDKYNKRSLESLRKILFPAKDERRFDKIILSLGSGRGKFEADLAVRNSNVAVIMIDAYSPMEGDNFEMFEYAEEFKWGKLPGQRLMLEKNADNIVVLKADMFRFLSAIPAELIDDIWVSAPEAMVLERLLDGLKKGELAKIMKTAGNLYIKAFHRDSFASLSLTGKYLFKPFQLPSYHIDQHLITEWKSDFPVMQWTNEVSRAMLSREEMRDVVHEFLKNNNRLPKDGVVDLEQITIEGEGTENIVIGYGNSVYRYFKESIISNDEGARFKRLGHLESEICPHFIAEGFIIGPDDLAHYVVETEKVFGRSVNRIQENITDEDFILLFDLVDHLISNRIEVFDFKPENVMLGYVIRELLPQIKLGYLVDVGHIRENRVHEKTFREIAQAYIGTIMGSYERFGWASWKEYDPQERIIEHIRSKWLNAAMVSSSSTTGGIDLNTSNWKLSVDGKRGGVVNFNAAQMASVGFDGLTPQVIDFVPIISSAEFMTVN